MTKVRLTSGTHRRPDGTIFEGGDIFEATEQELEAFGDRLVEVEKEDDEWTAIRGSTGIEEPEAGEYRLIADEHRTVDDDGNEVLLQEGDVTHLSETEAEAFADKFEPVQEGDEDEDEADEGSAEAEDVEEIAEGESETGGESAEDGDSETESEPESEELVKAPEIPDRDELESDEWTYPEIKSLAAEYEIEDPDVSQGELIDFLVERSGEESGEGGGE